MIVKQKPLVSAVSAVVVVAAAEDYDYFDGVVVAAVMGEKKSIFSTAHQSSHPFHPTTPLIPEFPTLTTARVPPMTLYIHGERLDD